jgi:hypothetical protein
MEQPRPRLGGPAPWFECHSPGNPRFHFDTVAGRYVVLCFFGVSVDPQDEATARVQEQVPGMHLFWDFDRRVSRLYGVAGESGDSNYLAQTFVLDERLRIVAVIPFSPVAEHHVDAVMNTLAALPRRNPLHWRTFPLRSLSSHGSSSRNCVGL